MLFKQSAKSALIGNAAINDGTKRIMKVADFTKITLVYDNGVDAIDGLYEISATKELIPFLNGLESFDEFHKLLNQV